MDKKAALEILNLDEMATLAEAKKAYRSLAKQYHPDVMGKNPSSRIDPEDRMKDINLAFRYLVPLLKSNRPVKLTSKTMPADEPPKKPSPMKKKKEWDRFLTKCEKFLNRLFPPIEKPADFEKKISGTQKIRVQSPTVSFSNYHKYLQLKQKMKSGRSRNPKMPIGRVTKIDPVGRIDAIRNE